MTVKECSDFSRYLGLAGYSVDEVVGACIEMHKALAELFTNERKVELINSNPNLTQDDKDRLIAEIIERS